MNCLIQVLDPFFCLLSPEWHLYLTLPRCLEFSCLCEFPMCTFKAWFSPVNLSYVILIICPARGTNTEGKGKVFPSPEIYVLPTAEMKSNCLLSLDCKMLKPVFTPNRCDCLIGAIPSYSTELDHPWFLPLSEFHLFEKICSIPRKGSLTSLRYVVSFLLYQPISTKRNCITNTSLIAHAKCF